MIWPSPLRWKKANTSPQMRQPPTPAARLHRAPHLLRGLHVAVHDQPITDQNGCNSWWHASCIT